MNTRVETSKIESFFKDCFSREGLSDVASERVISALINASLFGIDSHGIRLFCHYLDCIKSGRVNKSCDNEIDKKSNLFICNSKHNFAHSSAQDLLAEMNKFSKQSPIQMGIILNSDHYAASGIHAFNSSIKNRIIFSFTNADALATVPDGKSVVFGTNPISCVYNSSKTFLYIDFASTIFSMNKVKNYRLKNKNLPNNVARDKNGNYTTDPHAAVSLEPIGHHKGFGLGFIIEILTSGFTSMNHSFNLLSMYGTDLNLRRGVSHSFIMINPEIFPGGTKSIEKTIEITRKNLSEDQLNESPGIKEINFMNERKLNGIPVDSSILKQWIELGFKL